jgi:hypothetical protein
VHQTNVSLVFLKLLGGWVTYRSWIERVLAQPRIEGSPLLLVSSSCYWPSVGSRRLTRMSRFAEGMTNTEDDEERDNRIDRLQGSLPIYGSHGLVEQDGTHARHTCLTIDGNCTCAPSYAMYLWCEDLQLHGIYANPCSVLSLHHVVDSVFSHGSCIVLFAVDQLFHICGYRDHRFLYFLTIWFFKQTSTATIANAGALALIYMKVLNI